MRARNYFRHRPGIHPPNDFIATVVGKVMKGRNQPKMIAMKLRLLFALIIAVATLLSTSVFFTSKPSVEIEPDTYCNDHKKLMPFCNRCIPGLTFNEEFKTCELSEETSVIRKTLFRIARYRGNKNTCKVYNYLSTETLRKRHQYAAKYLDMVKPDRILDIGAYTNPIHSFMDHCPATSFVLEPCGELAHDGDTPYLSKETHCQNPKNLKITHTIQNVLPKSVKTFIKDSQHFDAIVCIGCDPVYGPTWTELMAVPRPFHLVLEATAGYATQYYPVDEIKKSGCIIKDEKYFDFSDCPDCGFDDKKQQSYHGKERKMFIYECKEHPQEVEKRRNESQAILSKYCGSNVNPSSYRGMACKGEGLMLSNMDDTALLAVDALTALEKKEMRNGVEITKKQKHDQNRTCSGKEIQKSEIARTWWATDQNRERLNQANTYLKMSKDVERDVYDALCYAASARSLFSAAEPQEKMIVPLHESIRVYQSLFQAAISHEKDASIYEGYRFQLKTCPPFLNKEYFNEVAEMEQILLDGRNHDSREYDALISFNPYRSLASFESVTQRKYRKKIIVDVGANGFAASPKQLVDNYAALGLQFDELVMFEPDADGMQKIPDIYHKKMTIKYQKSFVEIGTRKVESDLLSWLEDNVQEEDFVVVKFDVDSHNTNNGPTMEWGFLSDLLYSPALALIDELYIELHYRASMPRWRHETHTSRQAFDILRQLRACGMAIHAWP